MGYGRKDIADSAPIRVYYKYLDDRQLKRRDFKSAATYKRFGCSGGFADCIIIQLWHQATGGQWVKVYQAPYKDTFQCVYPDSLNSEADLQSTLKTGCVSE